MPDLPKRLEWHLLEETYYPDRDPSKACGGYTYRAMVPGGWLVAVWAGDTKHDHAWGGGLSFVADAAHKWEINTRRV